MNKGFVEPLDKLPSFREQIAYVYDDYMDTLGGGERSALAYALALQQMGFTVEILSKRPLPEQSLITKIFGREFSDIKLRHVPDGSIYTFAKSAEPMVFVNHTFLSFLPNPAKVGIYAQMFPVRRVTKESDPKEVKALDSYNFMASNATFTKNYTDQWWDYDQSRSKVLLPPIGSEFTKRAKHFLAAGLPKKNKTFVNIGRFNPGNHNKNQKLIIECFIEAQRKHPELKDWSLILVGNVNDTKESRAYFTECQDLARKSPLKIEFKCGISEGELLDLLSSSSAYVHATGAFIPPGQEPHKCEHFGLGIIEAMAHGCIPLVYARGGVFDVLKPGEMGIPYISRDGLMEGFKILAGEFNSTRGTAMATACVNAAASQGQQEFALRLARLLKEGLGK
jgi:glycosyltransferase involved in cell wall biosynthesis